MFLDWFEMRMHFN